MITKPAKLRCGIVGFGFIGPHHAEAIRRLGNVEIIAVSSRNVDLTRAKARRYGIPRVCESYEELVQDPDIDVIDIATPTYLHRPVALAAMAHGKHVIVDKPLSLSVAESLEMIAAARQAGVVNAVTFNYRYNPLVQQARLMVEREALGRIHLIHGHYLQEWLLSDNDFSWRLEPEKGGEGAMLADAGSHWFDLIEHVTGLRVHSVLSEIKTVIETRQRPLDDREAFRSAGSEATAPYAVRTPDSGAVFLRFSNGAFGTFLVSALCAGHKNDLRFELHGSTGSLAWLQEEPNRLWLGKRGEPDQIWSKDPVMLDPAIRRYAALPGGHNEAWPDAFKNIMMNIFEFIASGREAREANGVDFPTFESGLRTARIAEAIIASGKAGGVWTRVNATD